MNKLESAPSSHDTNPLRRLAGTKTGRLAVAATAAAGVLAGCSYQGVYGNTNTTPAASVVMDVLNDSHLLLCMKQVAGSNGDIIYDCDWRDSDNGTTPQEPRTTPRIHLSESDDSFNKSTTLKCLEFPLAGHHNGKTCDWSDPDLAGKTPGYPIQAVGYGDRDALCLSEKTNDYYQYTCNLDEPGGYNAPYNLTYISDGTFVEHSASFAGTTVKELVYNQGQGEVGAIVDWATFHPAK